MRIISKMLNSNTEMQYLNGDQVYYGAPERYYQSSLVTQLRAEVVRSPEGGNKLVVTDQDVLSNLQSIPFGQIGSMIPDDNIVPKNTIVYEVIVPTSSMVESSEIAKHLNVMSIIKEAAERLTFTTETGETLTYNEIKEKMKDVRDTNLNIREEWQASGRNLQKLGLSNDEIEAKKKETYEGYTSMSEYTLVLRLETRHFINNPEIKGYVVENFKGNYDKVNYAQNAVRKVSAVSKANILTVPLTSKDVADKLLNSYRIAKGENSVPHFKEKGIEHSYVYNSQSEVSSNIDFSQYKAHDRDVRN